LRKDFKETVIEVSAPGASLVFFARGGPVDFGRMNCFYISLYILKPTANIGRVWEVRNGGEHTAERAGYVLGSST